MNTLVLQSHSDPLPHAWLASCVDSVRAWANKNAYDYLWLDDVLFESLPACIANRLEHSRVIGSDLARLYQIAHALYEYHTVIWLDADFLIFDMENFNLPANDYAVGREVWIQFDKNGKLKAYKKVHNAFLMFRRENAFLKFYIESAEKLVLENHGSMSPQYVGPKLLTALHNVVQFPVFEQAGMLSPAVTQDILHGGGDALSLFLKQSPEPVAGLNLCCSSCNNGELSDEQMQSLIDLLSARDSNKVMANIK